LQALINFLARFADLVNGFFKVSVVGSLANRRGLAANKPAANTVDPGTTYWSVDTDPHGDAVEVSDGTNWVVI
jgi:hypothetical protein